MSEDSRLSAFLKRQSRLAPTRVKYRLVRHEHSGGETVVCELAGEKADAAVFEQALSSDLQTQSGNQLYRLFAIGADSATLATFTVRGKGSAPDEGASGVNGQLAKLVADAFEQTGEQRKGVDGHVLLLLGREHEEILDLRRTVAELSSENLKLNVDIATLKAGEQSENKSEIVQHITTAIQSLPATIAQSVAAFKGIQQPKIATGPIGAIREAAGKLSDSEVEGLILWVLENPQYAREIAGILQPASALQFKPLLEAFVKSRTGATENGHSQISEKSS